MQAGPLVPGATFADHLIQAVAGAGAHGAVYRALHLPSGETRALKVALEPSDDAAPPAPPAALQHPDIIQIFQVGSSSGRHWQSMEWVPGQDLTRYTQPAWLLPPQLSLAIVARLARAVAHAHHAGITHRDLKPGNVRVHLARDVVKLGDFGIARMPDASATRTGLLMGTPAYMAPELLGGASASAPSDLYGLGAILYELLTAHRPYEADSLGALLKAIGRTAPRPLSTWLDDPPPALEGLLADLLDPRPDRRPHDGHRLADTLDTIRLSLPMPAH